MKQACDVYLFGQVLGTHSFLLRDGFLQPDEYAEIAEQYFLPGGETGTAATVLSSLGVSVRMDGTWIGTEVAPMLKAFYRDKTVDLSSLCFTEDKGVMDYVVIAGLVRSPMGRFQTLFSTGKRWWSIPKEEDIASCKAAAVDPFFADESLLAAELCRKHKVPFVTIDSPHDSALHRLAAVNVVSKECTAEHYAGMAPEAIMELMQQETDGLTVITQGGGEMLYARKGEPIHRMKPFSVDVRSTLGAGDTFKAGCVYGLLHGMDDETLVRFASACSGIAISRFPLPLNPPKPDEVRELIKNGKTKGQASAGRNRSANMLKSRFYACPSCGNVLFARGDAVISCCGIQLPPLEAEEADGKHGLGVRRSEDEIYVSSDHCMSKEHYLPFIAYMTPDRCEIKALYPEGNAEARFFYRGKGWLYCCCSRHGLFRQEISLDA